MSTPPYSSVRPLLTIDDLCRTLKIGRTQVYELVRRGDLPTVRVGARIRFRPEDVESYLERDRDVLADTGIPTTGGGGPD